MSVRLLCIFVVAIVSLIFDVSFVSAATKTEKEKIEALIKHVEDLKDAKFVRNGVEYDAASAGKFLRGKWATNEASIKTAKDFIEKSASESSTTGKPYLIRFKNGKETKSREYLQAELKKLETATKCGASIL